MGGEVEHPPAPPPSRSEAGAAPNQASLAAPSASERRGQMEARPHMLPHIRWRLEEEEGGGGRCAHHLLALRSFLPATRCPRSANPAPECSFTSIPPAAACFQGRLTDSNIPALLRLAVSVAAAANG